MPVVNGGSRLGALCLAVLTLAACAAPTASPTGSAQTSAPTAAPVQGATKPTAAPKAESAAPAQKPAWQDEWLRTIEAAKREKLIIATMPGSNDQRLMAAFQKAFPDIPVEHTGARPSDFSPKLIGEQRNGVFAWDVMESSGATNMHEVLMPADAFQDIRPFFLLPDAIDPAKWQGGTFELYTAPDKPYILIHDWAVRHTLYVNRDVIPREELNSLDGLLDPKWRGKIVVDDCTVPAQGTLTLTGVLNAKGEAFVRRLLTEPQPVFQETVRITSEWVATGRYPIAIGADDQNVARLQAEGVGKNVELLQFEGGSAAVAAVAVFKNAPHPNASKVFLNWFWSQEGQLAWLAAWGDPVPRNSRRADVPVADPASMPDYNHLERYPARGTDTGTEMVNTVMNICKSVRG
jgi:ABC-type Fe3+ transport system substrate-binding protein